MYITFARIGNCETVRFASEELRRYLKLIDNTVFVDERRYDEKTDDNSVIWVGIDGSVPASDEDEIKISVKNGCGIITGSNNRAVLIAAYRFLKELGCEWLYPGPDGEFIHSLTLTPELLNIQVSEKASYFHRTVCNEGSMGYEHTYNMIDWLPKAGMNGYFSQFFTPDIFYSRWYNDEMKMVHGQPMCNDSESFRAIHNSVEDEITKRSLLYHTVGHGFTLEPFGIRGLDWFIDYTGKEDEAPEAIKPYMAEIDGKRIPFKGKLCNTQLCYSNPEVQNLVADTIVDYCKKNPTVSYVGFWVADNCNNHCECPECQKMIPSDYYVQILNLIDEKLTKEGIDTKIEIAVYCEMMWAPEVETIKNPDRFSIMLCPAHRGYETILCDYDHSEKVEIPKYVRNQIELPDTVALNVEMFKGWQKQVPKRTSDFDYHLYATHFRDLGYYYFAKVLHDDCANFDKSGLDGIVSCQAQRVSFPVGMPMYAMAAALWDKNSVYEKVSERYFDTAFGKDARIVEKYLRDLSIKHDWPYTFGERGFNIEADMKKYDDIIKFVDDFYNSTILKNIDVSIQWKYLAKHAEYCKKYIPAIQAHILQDKDMIERTTQELREFIAKIQPEVHRVFDVQHFDTIFKNFFVGFDMKIAEFYASEGNKNGSKNSADNIFF